MGDQQNRTTLLFSIITGESVWFPQLARAFVKNIEKVGLDFLTQYFSLHPKLKIADPEVTARVFIGTLIHFVMTRDVLHSGDLIPMERDRLLDSLLHLLLQTSPASEPSRSAARAKKIQRWL